MSNKILIKRSSVAGKIPATTDLDFGELALNTHDGNLYTRFGSSIYSSIVMLGGNYSYTGDLNGSFVGTTTLSLTLKNSGVTPGTYNQVVVNSKGLVTSGSVYSGTFTPTIEVSTLTLWVNGDIPVGIMCEDDGTPIYIEQE